MGVTAATSLFMFALQAVDLSSVLHSDAAGMWGQKRWQTAQVPKNQTAQLLLILDFDTGCHMIDNFRAKIKLQVGLPWLVTITPTIKIVDD